MQVQNSSFQRISISISLLFLLLSLTQCKADTVWGISQSTFLERLARQENAFLSDLQIEDGNLAEAFRLGPGAPYYLAIILISLEREQTAEKLLTLQWQRGDSPWREEAALLRLSIQMDNRRYEEAEILAKQILRRAREQRYTFPAKRKLVEAVYWQEQDEEVLTLLEEMRNSDAPWDDELDLFTAVSSQRLERQGWKQLFIDLFYSKRTSILHSRAYAYLEQEGVLDSFPQGASLFFQSKDLLYRGRNSEAIDLIEKSLPGLEIEQLDPDILIEEMGAAYFAVAEHNRGAEVLLDLSDRFSPSQRLAAIEMAGRLYRKEGNFPEARRLLAEVVRETDSPEQRDRAIWFALDMARSLSPGEFLDQVEELASEWHDPIFFKAILEPEISRLVAQRNWEDLHLLYRLLQGYGPPETMARLAYINARAVSLGMLDSSGSEVSLSPQSLFLEARSVGEGYYRYLSEAALTDMGFPLQWSIGAADQPDSSSPSNGAEEQTGYDDSLEILIRGYFEYGLYERGMELLRSHWRTLPPGLILDSALILQDRGEYLSSLRLMNLYVLRKPMAAERGDLELLYPQAFGEHIGGLAKDEDIPASVFFALVREESYFDPQIVSRSGAIGLTQLMPETAGDSARRLRMEEYDLRDPEQNLRLGARHFSRLLSRLEDIPKALMAYNAGLSRLRSWERNFAGLPTDLLAEAIPFPETRNYVRKILVSAVYYGGLYYDQSLEETVFLFFPGLK